MKKKNCQNVQQKYSKKIYILANVLVGAFVIMLSLGALAAVLGYKAFENAQQTENLYKKSLNEAANDVSNIESKLSKAIVSTDNFETALYLNDIWRQADNASSNLAQLPLEHDSISNTLKLVNQIGDCCYSFSKKLAAGSSLDDDQQKTIEDLFGYAQSAKQSLNNLSAEVNSQNYRIVGSISRDRAMPNSPRFADGFDVMQKNSVDYPKIIYDGPFSDNVKQKEFRAVKHLEELSHSQAQQKLSDIFQGQISTIEYYGQAGGDVATYEFNIVFDDNSQMYAQLCKQGGVPLLLSSDRDVRLKQISQEQAIKNAEQFVKKLGFDSMEASWYNEISNIAYVNMAYTQDDVRIYPDLAIVKIALDDGRILGCEAASYCCSHQKRENTKPTISLNTAKNSVSKKLEINSSRLAIIPKENTEILTYEFECEYKGLDYFVYIDAYNGKQVEILRVIDGQQGKLLG